MRNTRHNYRIRKVDGNDAYDKYEIADFAQQPGKAEVQIAGSAPYGVGVTTSHMTYPDAKRVMAAINDGMSRNAVVQVATDML